ncbi:TPA: hypothetical protein EYP44_02890 [Candidatus Bathyarchaeota archaeon]|nr:hypothetical protein [Candidatus Bathyarchaeota archaeon]
MASLDIKLFVLLAVYKLREARVETIAEKAGLWPSLVRYVIRDLRQKGFVDEPEEGVFCVSQKGLEVIAPLMPPAEEA